MSNYVLDVKPGHMVEFVMITQDGTRVKNAASFWWANDRLQGKGEVRSTEDVPGFPLTVDGVYFFAGYMEMEDGGAKRKGRRGKRA